MRSIHVMKRAVVLCALLAGCLPPKEARDTTPAPAAVAPSGQVCHEERPLGSNIARTVCRSQDQIERDRRETQKLVHNPGPPGSKSQ
jgi:hypothetical protein